MSDINPYQATSEIHQDPFATASGAMASGQYGGISRLTYFLGYIGLTFLQNFVNVTVFRYANEQSTGLLVLGCMLLAFVGSAFLAGQRMINQGSSGWWGLAAIVPILNLWIGLRCLICPTGYSDHRTLDRTGKLIGLVLLGVVVMGAIAIVGLFSTNP